MGHPYTAEDKTIAAFTRCIWILAAVMIAATIISFSLTGVRVDPLSRPLLLVPFSVLTATWCLYTYVRPDERLRALAESFLQLLVILLAGTLMSYAAAVPLPFQDTNLLAIDTALGIDRQVYIEFFSRRPWLHNAVTLAYFTLMPQFVVVPLLLFFLKQTHRLQLFIFAAGVGLFATVLISIFTPSITTIYLDLGLPVGAPIPDTRYTPLPTLNALRSGLPYWIDLSAAEGLISFPSFHTVGASLFVWALASVPYVRWVVAVLNAGLIAAAPFIGAHYFVDIAGGAVVAVAAIAAARTLSRASSREATFAAPAEDIDGVTANG